MTSHRQLDLSVLAKFGIVYRFVGAHPFNYGYPVGTQHQCEPECVVWHITASSPSPGDNPLAGLDDWFNRPTTGACSHIGISGRFVSEYVPWHVACYHAGRMASSDYTNPYIKRWKRENQNPNFFGYGIEVVAQPGPERVPPGTVGPDPVTWETMRYVASELERQLGIQNSLDQKIGHGQIDGISRARDPFNVYLPTDIHSGEEEPMFMAWDTGRTRAYLVGGFGAAWITDGAEADKLKERYGPYIALSSETIDNINNTAVQSGS